MLAICYFFLSQNHFRPSRQKIKNIKTYQHLSETIHQISGWVSEVKKYLGFKCVIHKKLGCLLRILFLSAFQYSKTIMCNVYSNSYQSYKMSIINQIIKEKDICISQLFVTLFWFSALRSYCETCNYFLELTMIQWIQIFWIKW